jgi:PilZ domain
MSRDRRRSTRIDILGRLRGEVLEGTARQVTVRELSLGGLSLESPDRFEIGSIHGFRLTLGDGASVFLRGRVVYSREVGRSGDAPLFVTGVHFTDDDGPEQDPGLDDLMKKIT